MASPKDTATSPNTTAVKRKKIKKQVADGIACINATFNNTLVTITDLHGNVLAWNSAAKCGFKGSKKATPYAAGEAAQQVAQYVIDTFGLKSIEIRVKGPGAGRESCARSLAAAGLKVKSIIDVTGIPANGCKPCKKRRV